MKYLIPDLLNNQTLRKELLDKAFCLKDENGVFSGLDFLGSSLRANHRAVFDAIAANGGDAALEQVLSQNNTCLTSDPHAAKQGVVPVRGSNAYFIKTNAGAPLAFQSILTAIWDYANDAEGFDRDGIYLLDEADIDEAEPEAEQVVPEHPEAGVVYGAPLRCSSVRSFRHDTRNFFRGRRQDPRAWLWVSSGRVCWVSRHWQRRSPQHFPGWLLECLLVWVSQ